jgi:hypothetical protein
MTLKEIIERAVMPNTLGETDPWLTPEGATSACRRAVQGALELAQQRIQKAGDVHRSAGLRMAWEICRALAAELDDKPPLTPSQQQRADWAYGNTKLSNPDVTREMAENAVREKDKRK